MQVLPQILTLRCKFTGCLPLNMWNRFIRFGDPSLLISFLSPKVLMDENTKGWYIYTEARHHVMIPLWWLNIYKIWLSVSILFFALSINHVSLIFFYLYLLYFYENCDTTFLYGIIRKLLVLFIYMHVTSYMLISLDFEILTEKCTPYIFREEDSWHHCIHASFEDTSLHGRSLCGFEIR